MTSPARIVCIPSADASFAAEVQRVADRVPGGLAMPDAFAWFVAEIQRVLPGTLVREQDELAHVAGTPPVWYVTRRRHHFRIDTEIWVPLSPMTAYGVYVERVAEWQTAVRLRPIRPGLPVMGTEFEAIYSFMGIEYSGAFRILAADPGRSVSIEARGSGISVWYVTSFRPERGGTLVKVKGDYEVPNNFFARIADRLIVERTIGR
ncbi:MAG TPA: hypothetical protein VF484_04090, partial [Candidatus Limnocylindrales bacterium]